MTDKLALVRAYLFGTPQDREEARLILADWMLDESLYAEEAKLRLRRVAVWVLTTDWEDQEFILGEAPSVEYAVEKCKRVFFTAAEKDAWLAGYSEAADHEPLVFESEAECYQQLAPMWQEIRIDQQDMVTYDDSDLMGMPAAVYEEEDDEDDLGVKSS